jgi:hypothetical protein
MPMVVFRSSLRQRTSAIRAGAGAWLWMVLMLLMMIVSLCSVRSLQLSRARRAAARSLRVRIVQEAGLSAIRAALHQVAMSAEGADRAPAPAPDAPEGRGGAFGADPVARLVDAIASGGAGLSAAASLPPAPATDLFGPEVSRGLRVSAVDVKCLSGPGVASGPAARGVLRFETTVTLSGGDLTCRRRVIALVGYVIDPLAADGRGVALDRNPMATLLERA